jgi:hypothetical protein
MACLPCPPELIFPQAGLIGHKAGVCWRFINVLSPPLWRIFYFIANKEKA